MDLFQVTDTSLHWRISKLDTAFLMHPPQCEAERHNHFSHSTGCAFANPSHDMLGLHHLEGTVPTAVQLVYQGPHIFFCRAAPSQPASNQSALVRGIASSQLQGVCTW